jgi:hypothetical protein
MHFDEKHMGNYRIFVGALEAPKGSGYTAMMVVEHIPNGTKRRREVIRDENMACGHQWPSASDALSYAIKKAQKAVNEVTAVLSR